MRHSLPAAVALLVALASPALAAKPHYELTGRVVAIADGDTLTVLDAEKVQHKIRLAGIDAPEKGQAFGTKAREDLAGKVFRQDVRVEVIDVDRYKREVGRIYLGDRSTPRWSATVSLGDTSSTTSRVSSPPPRTTLASIAAGCGPILMPSPRGSGDGKSGRHRSPHADFS